MSIRAKQAQRFVLLLEQDEAEVQLLDLKRRSQKLCSILGNVRKSFGG